MTVPGVPAEWGDVQQRALTGNRALQIAVDTLSADDARFIELDASRPLVAQLHAVFASEAEQAVLMLIHASAVSFSEDYHRRLPVLRPYAIRDRRKRKGSGRAELWGVPDELGYFCDDNTLLKALPKGLNVVSDNQQLLGCRVTTGWTCCHAWRSLPTGGRASKHALLNSFVPGLMWLPTALAPFTDREDSKAQRLLKDMAMSFVGDVPAPLKPYVNRAWSLLLPEGGEPDRVATRHRFAFSEAFIARRVQSIQSVVRLLEDPSKNQNLRLLNSRYRQGVLDLSAEQRRTLAAALTGYADAVVAAPSAQGCVALSPAFPEPEQ